MKQKNLRAQGKISNWYRKTLAIGVGVLLSVLGTFQVGAAAVWDTGCQRAIHHLLDSQQKISVTRQRVESRKLTLVLSKGVFTVDQDRRENPFNLYSDAVNEWKLTIKNFGLSLSEFKAACLGNQ
ncbi:MAG: hypothetical protein VST66_01280 [Nitrospirota bacterium]|nr:hypothetical protein [Nitrospirota bacterium]